MIHAGDNLLIWIHRVRGVFDPQTLDNTNIHPRSSEKSKVCVGINGKMVIERLLRHERHHRLHIQLTAQFVHHLAARS